MNERALTQADGTSAPLKNDARAYINEALQIIEFHRGRLQMSMGGTAAKGLEHAISNARRELDAERAAAIRQQIEAFTPGGAAARNAAREALAEMERTNRELALTGDQLAIEEALDR